MRDDIYGGLKNAIERGATLDQAVRSFINAGYSESEVREAAKSFMPPVLSVTNPSTTPNTTNSIQKRPMPIQARPPQQQQSPPAQPNPQMQFATISPPPEKSNKTIIILVAVLTLLVGVFVTSLLFRNEIASVIKTALGG